MTVDEAVAQYQRYGIKLPAPNLDLGRVRNLQNAVDSSLDSVF